MTNGGQWDKNSLPKRPGVYVNFVERTPRKQAVVAKPPKTIHLHVPEAIAGENTI